MSFKPFFSLEPMVDGGGRIVKGILHEPMRSAFVLHLRHFDFKKELKVVLFWVKDVGRHWMGMWS